MRVSCPPIISACYMGVGFTSRRELIAKMMGLEELTRYVGAALLRFNAIDGLISCIGLPESELCLARLTGKYLMTKSIKLEVLEEHLGR